ncbi:MAG: NUDIX hydrolase [Candidatus Saccharimonas sp.]
MKEFTRIEPTSRLLVGERYKKSVVIKRYRTDDGLEHEFTTFFDEHTQSAAVIAVTPDGQVIVSNQFRPGREAWLEEIPGGALEHGEDPRQGAERELLEETGYRTGTMKYLGAFSWNANSNLTSHYFLATNCVLSNERTYEQVEVDQGLEVRKISITQLIDNAKSNRMSDAAAVLMALDDLSVIEHE